jgi:hypothetical protein
MLSNVSKLSAALVTSVVLFHGVAIAAPEEMGACCHLNLGCCDAPAELEGDPRGAGGGQCRIATQQSCNGIADTYKGDGTTCEQFCPIATTTTTLPTGACCHLFNGCCPAPSELQDVGVEGGVGGGECRTSTSGDCNGIADTYKGDGTTCEEQCVVPTTTSSTTTTLPTGACCEPLGTCLEVTEQNCVIGDYQGDATTCATVECTQPTTTTVPDTTTSTTYNPPTTTVPDTTTTTEQVVVLCGDANGDGEVTSVDALIALRTSVGIAACPETRCDYNGNGQVQSSDALAILRVSVGQLVVPMCPVL